MNTNECLLIQADAKQGLSELKNESVQLVITSPPYSDIRKSYQGYESSEYIKWFENIGKEILRCLKPSGVFILNFGDKCENGEKIQLAFELAISLKSLGFKFIDTIIWVKSKGLPCASSRRASNYFEYIFYFAKTTKPKWNPDPIRTPYAEASKARAKHLIKDNVSNRETRTGNESYKKWILNQNGAYPKNVLFFPQDDGKDHPAAFHVDLPSYFIKAHTDNGDMVIDPFAGRGTSVFAAKLLGRDAIGFDLKREYIQLGMKKYDLVGKLNEK